MDVVLTITIALAALTAGFVLGVIFHKYVLDSEQRIKDHITAELADVKKWMRGGEEVLKKL